MEGYLQSRVQAGTVRPVNTRVIVQAMVGSFLVFVLLSEPDEEDLFTGVSHGELAAELADFFLHGLQPKPS
jgi:hypothetical protein